GQEVPDARGTRGAGRARRAHRGGASRPRDRVHDRRRRPAHPVGAGLVGPAAAGRDSQPLTAGLLAAAVGCPLRHCAIAALRPAAGRHVVMERQQPAGPLGPDVAVTHILVVADPARSRDFWVNVLGAELYREYGGTSVVLRFAGTWLLLVTG